MEEVIILLTSSHVIALFEIVVEPQCVATTVLLYPCNFFSPTCFFLHFLLTILTHVHPT